MANVNPATASGNASGNKKEPEAPASGLTLSHPGEATAPAAPPQPGPPFPVGPSGRLVRIDN